MKLRHLIGGFDSHTAGEPTRIITSGLPPIPGASMREKIVYMRQRLDYLRSALTCEPRGHNALVVAYLTPPINPESSYGVIFANNVGYLEMCGHGLIGVATVLVELGYMPKREGTTAVFFDTSGGTVEARVRVEDDTVQSVSITNVPAFVYQEEVSVSVPGIGTVVGDIAYGGNWFFLVPASELGVLVEHAEMHRLMELSTAIQVAATKLSLPSPWQDAGCKVDHIKIIDHVPTSDSASRSRSFVLCPGREYDRSPCGTGLSAELSLMHLRGKLAVGASHVSESVLGSEFVGRITGVTDWNSGPAVIPEITGSAYITGIAQFVVDARDPFRYGFGLVGIET